MRSSDGGLGHKYHSLTLEARNENAKMLEKERYEIGQKKGSKIYLT